MGWAGGSRTPVRTVWSQPAAPPKRRGLLLRFLSQFNNVLIYVLLARSSRYCGAGALVDTGVIIAVVLINALVGYVQEGKGGEGTGCDSRSALTPGHCCT